MTACVCLFVFLSSNRQTNKCRLSHNLLGGGANSICRPRTWPLGAPEKEEFLWVILDGETKTFGFRTNYVEVGTHVGCTEFIINECKSCLILIDVCIL